MFLHRLYGFTYFLVLVGLMRVIVKFYYTASVQRQWASFTTPTSFVGIARRRIMSGYWTVIPLEEMPCLVGRGTGEFAWT